MHPDAPVVIGLNWLGGWFPLTVHEAVITLRLNRETTGPHTATEGVISGVMDTEEFIADIQRHLWDLCHSSWICSCGESPTMTSFLGQFVAASDVMKDGSQDPTSACDGISIGLGFEATAVKLGPAMDRQPPLLDPCTD